MLFLNYYLKNKFWTIRKEIISKTNFTHNTTTVGDSKFQKVQTHLNFVKKLKLLILESTSVCQTNTANITARTYINEHTTIPKTTVN